ncbi:MAG: Lhr family helicase, partial [Burkholderiales bacterium]
RMYAEDVLQSVFPDAAACLDNIQGAREVPEHPLVEQAMRDCLEEAMDSSGLEKVLGKIFAGEVRLIAKDLPEPSVLSHELLNSAVYTFLDDAPLEERRTRAVYTRRATEPRSADDLGTLDPAAIERVREEAWPVANTADELHDALMVAGYIEEGELEGHWKDLLLQLKGRVANKDGKWFAIERQDDSPEELLASRLEVLGPVAAPEDALLLALEGQGRILRGRFSSNDQLEWCDRRLLARIHRYTLNKLRAEIEPVSAAEFMRFLMHWQHVAGEDRVHGADGLAAVIEQLEGFELAAAAWEHDVLPARVADYEPEQIDRLCLSGRVAWGRLSAGTSAPLKSSPIGVMLRAHAVLADPIAVGGLSSEAQAVKSLLEKRGASFFGELAARSSLLPSVVERALAELVGAGLVTADSFAGLRALLAPAERRKGLVEAAGRWALLSNALENNFEALARTLLKRYGVVFRSLLERESRLPPWRDLVRVYRRLEARGEIRGGRFVKGFGGEQFAAADAVGRLRAVRKLEKAGELVVLSAADPLNLVGILTPEGRVPAIHRNRVLFKDGLPIAVIEGGQLRRLAESELDDSRLRTLLARSSPRHPQRLHLRTPGPRETARLERVRDRVMNFPWR